jgi:predicted transcriptional regulator
MADPVVKELIAIKKLLVYALLKNGLSQAAVATALDTDQSSVSRMFGEGGATKRPRKREGKKEAPKAATDGNGD